MDSKIPAPFYHLKNVTKRIIICFLILFPLVSFAEDDDSARAREGFLITVSRFESVILSLNKRINKKQATRLATLIAIESKKQNIDPRIFLAILNTESSFNQKAISTTGDISIAQFNPKVWTDKRFKEKTGFSIDHNRLKNEEAYAISRMGILLSWLKKNFAKEDKWWFARYHSATPTFKKIYISKLTSSFRKIKPFGRNLLKDMPPLNKIVALKNKNGLYLASNSAGEIKYEIK